MDTPPLKRGGVIAVILKSVLFVSLSGSFGRLQYFPDFIVPV